MAHVLVAVADANPVLIDGDSLFIDPTGALVIADHIMEISHAFATGVWLAVDRVAEKDYQRLLANRKAGQDIPGENPLDTPRAVN
jgi:hypothetical protein